MLQRLFCASVTQVPCCSLFSVLVSTVCLRSLIVKTSSDQSLIALHFPLHFILILVRNHHASHTLITDIAAQFNLGPNGAVTPKPGVLGHPHRGYMHRPKYYEESCSGGSDGLGRDHERLLADLLRRRQAGMFGGQHPGLGGMGGHHPGLGRMGGHPPPFMGGQGMHPMMGRPGFPPPMGMVPSMGMGMSMGMPPGMGMGMGMGMPRGTGMGMHPGMGMGMGMGPGIGMGMGMGMGPSRSPFLHSPFGHGGPGPPRAHFFPPNRHAHSPFSHSHSRQSPFSSRRMFDDDDDYDDDYRMPSRHRHSRQMRGGFRFASRNPARRRGYRPGMLDESDDDFDEYEDYDENFEDEDDYESYVPRRSPQRRWRGGY
ncbi:hypothetical protein CC86DRAFT_459326 [Ophiobolus disseminans]|uniref:Uncharacterized protein n=1 Tax=Ophiobolus disseminans TaxID=1469910 RepID=A0A6A6ZLF5_9PLEO|nr:hypothetical protein CC86DRAFT_459326 [Ophiobolus disseminans]